MVKHANHKNSFYKYTFVYSVSLTVHKYPSHFKTFKTKKTKTKQNPNIISQGKNTFTI